MTMAYRKLLIQLMLWSLAGTALMGAFNAVLGSGEAGWRFVGTGVAFAIAAGVMIPFAARADKPESRLEGLAGMTLIILLFCAVLGLIWNVFQAIGGDEMSQRVGTSILFLAMSGLPGVTFLRLVSKPGFRVGGW